MDWMTLAVNCRCDSVELWLLAARHGCYGKMFRTRFESTKEGLSPQSATHFGNAGILSPTEFLTLETSESPSDAVECFLSDIADDGNAPPQSYLTATQIANLRRRVEKYQPANLRLLAVLDAAELALPETRRQSSESRSRQR